MGSEDGRLGKCIDQGARIGLRSITRRVWPEDNGE
jgi:hypothetical protein